MSALASDYLLFKMAGGKSVAFSAEMVSVEPAGGAAELFDQEFLTHATKAVFHYFKHELRRQTVSVGEFASALEKVLRGFALTGQAAARTPCAPRVLESDLRRLACESGKGCELFFFPRLRHELRRLLRQSPRVLRFRGLRGCVKQLAGARRWTPHCRSLDDQIVAYLRACLCAEAKPSELALVVD